MIRIAKENDINILNKLGLLLNDNFIKTYNLNNYIKNNNYIILLNEEDNINAMIIIYKNIDYYELETIVVSPQHRNKKIATNLINYFINNYTNKDDVILLEVAAGNDNAIKLYKKFDFEIINIRKKYYGSVDAYVMKKVI